MNNFIRYLMVTKHSERMQDMRRWWILRRAISDAKYERAAAMSEISRVYDDMEFFSPYIPEEDGPVCFAFGRACKNFDDDGVCANCPMNDKKQKFLAKAQAYDDAKKNINVFKSNIRLGLKRTK